MSVKVLKESDQNNELINPVEFIKTIKKNKKVILLIFYLFIFIGIFLVVFSRNTFVASTIIVPQTSSKTDIGGGIGGLAAMAGIDLNSMGSESSISPQLYPQILGSTPFLKELIRIPIYFSDQGKKTSYQDFYLNEYKPSVLEYLKDYTVGLPGILIKWIKGDDTAVLSDADKGSLIRISMKEKKLIKQVQQQLHLNINKKEGYINLNAEMPTARAAAEFTKAAQDLLQKYIIEFKIQKSQSQLDFVKERYNEKEKDFREIQSELATYRDKNQNINSALGVTKLEQLKSKYEMAYDVYVELAKQLEKQLIQVKEDTPVFTIVQPVYVPIEKASPRRFFMLLSWTFLGLFAGLSFAFLKLIFINVKGRLINRF